ncbi:5-carboxymethyl-2-hydroxymuconate Delta-isomerase [uncultured Endozoicomonas sp.]|uniref:5-carboxymethyl-2-hydroxymuconate Delta-isomerase n=1 Tax=uncultured Endozoicomonas sp. TaxID=432652 RepID=UPI002631101E|nr:5-carboxymethyl-2-hydroxymuconate Delta-isomerase [uncultured Endozoicomonas sp.]
MPHFIIECSRSIEKFTLPDQLMSSVFQSAVQSGLFNETDIKVRVQPFDHYLLPVKRMDFIHVTARILSGRSEEQKQLLSENVMDALAGFGFKNTLVSVDVEDSNRAVYLKRVV